ncbi:Fatty acid synthase [Halotydeus destructor]|nr:Fatty acid synthase [Halotydeus destructor]
MDIAISGISGRFPSSEDLEQFKDNLFKGVDLITEDKHRWPPGMFGLPPRNGILSSMDKFDAEFFGFTDTQAEIMEPTERMCYELTTEALYDAGIDPKCIRGQGSRWGIYHGSCFTFVSNKFSDPELVPTFVPRDLCRLSRHLGVTGQLFHSDTACASGLTAFNEAVFALKSQMIDYAIVLGYNALLKSRVSIGFKKMRMISPDGKCKCHDESADGYVRSEAAVVLILQRYNTNPKRIYAKILASKANSDGYKQQGVTFPSVDGQCDLLDITYKSIGLDPSCINYVEAHVTGTQAGDVVESNALHEFFFNRHRRRAPLMLGCLKSSMGHSEGASGLCSLAKALIVHQARKIPQNLHLKTPNSKIPPLLSGELKPITEITELNDSLIAVNCFGFGGSNVHVITERHDTDGQKSCTFPRLVPACGRTQEALDHMVNTMASATDYLEDGFLSLVQGYAMQPADGMPWRGCLLVSSYKDIKRMPPLRCFPNKKKLVLHVKDNAMINDADVTVLLKTFPQFAKSMRMLQNTLTKELLSHDSKHQGLSRKMQSLLICLSLINLIKSLQIRFDKFYASGLNVLLGAYIENQLSAPEIVEITCAYLCNQDNKADLVRSLEKVYQSRNKKWPNVQSLLAAIEEPKLALNGHHSKDVVLSMSASGIQVGRSVHSCPAKATLEAIGQVYIAGHHVNFEALYAQPTGPLPTSTPFFSPLVKWNHGKTYSLVHYIGDESNNFYYRTSKSIDFEFEHSNALDTFVYDHVIDGRKLFPATGYLMLAWYTLAETIKKNPLDLIVRWSNVRYNRATVLNEKSKTRITVRINDATNSFEVIEGFQAIVTGFIQVLEQPTGNKMLLPHTEQPVFLDSTAMYRELRVRGYDYAPFFQGIQSVTSDGSAGRVAWRQVAPKLVLESLQQSTDSSTLWLRAFVPFADSLLQLQLLNKRNNHRCLVVPTSIDEIICDPRQLMVHIDSSDKFVDKATDLLTPQLDGWYDDDTNTVFTRGLLIKGLKASAISRRKQDPVVHTYSFVPYLDSTVYDEIPFNHLVDIVVGNLVSGSSRLSIKIIEFHSCGNPLANGIIEAIKSNVLASTIDVDYVLETETEPTNISSGVRIVKSSLTLREEANSKDFVIISSQDQQLSPCNPVFEDADICGSDRLSGNYSQWYGESVSQKHEDHECSASSNNAGR